MSLSVMLWHMWSIVTKLWHFQARKVYRFTFCRCNQQLNVVSSWSKICFSPIVLVIYDPNYNLSKNVKFWGDRDSELSPIFIHQKGRKKRSSSELFKRHIKIVQHVVWHIYRYYITIIFVQVNFTNESFLKESAQIHNIIFRFLWLLINAFTNTCSILNITFSCHSSLRKSNRLLTVFLWAYFEHTMAFFDTFSLFSLSSQQTRELRSFFTYITLSFTPEQIACTPAVFTFNFCIFSFFFCLFVCQAGVTKARSMSLSKANKQRNEQNGQDMYFFCSASWTSRAVQRKQKTLLCIIQSLIKNRLGRICGGHVGYADVNLGLTVRRKGFKMSAIICSGSTTGVTGYNGYYVVKATLNL